MLPRTQMNTVRQEYEAYDEDEHLVFEMYNVQEKASAKRSSNAES